MNPQSRDNGRIGFEKVKVWRAKSETVKDARRVAIVGFKRAVALMSPDADRLSTRVQQWADYINVDPENVTLIEALLEPDALEHRFGFPEESCTPSDD